MLMSPTCPAHLFQHRREKWLLLLNFYDQLLYRHIWKITSWENENVLERFFKIMVFLLLVILMVFQICAFLVVIGTMLLSWHSWRRKQRLRGSTVVSLRSFIPDSTAYMSSWHHRFQLFLCFFRHLARPCDNHSLKCDTNQKDEAQDLQEERVSDIHTTKNQSKTS